jgi:hypothetical protein
LIPPNVGIGPTQPTTQVTVQTTQVVQQKQNHQPITHLAPQQPPPKGNISQQEGFKPAAVHKPMTAYTGKIAAVQPSPE